jgi:hypothetical protein
LTKAQPTKLPDASDIVSFSSLVACLEDGALDRDLTAALQRIVAHMGRAHRKGGGHPSGKISLVVDLLWADGMIQTRQSFKAEPASERVSGRFYASPDGALSQQSPYQQESLLTQTKPETGGKRP